MQKYRCSVSLCNFANVNNGLVNEKINLYIRRFTVYIKQIRFIAISGVEYFSLEPKNVLNELFFKWLRMLPFKVIFQSLDGKYLFLFYFTWNFSYVLTLLHFAHVCVNLYKIYDSHTERTSKLVGKKG